MLLPDQRCGSSLLVSPVFDRLPRVRHGFTTLALGDSRGAPPGGEAVTRAVQGDGAWARHGLNQVHGAVSLQAGETTSGDPLPYGDALFSARRGDLLVIRSADCVPVLLAALGPGGVLAVGAAHAGWRGLVAGILPSARAALERAAPGARLIGALGPCIGPCCFEVGADVAARLESLGDPGALRTGEGGRVLADLPRLARFQLAAAGVAVADPSPPPCTRCHPELFPSWRRDGSAASRLASFVGMRAA
jgi:polyphenol oxidase